MFFSYGNLFALCVLLRYLGGGFSGNRLAKIYKEGIDESEILTSLRKLLSEYAVTRQTNEHFGDWCVRTEVVQPTLAGRLFHETEKAINAIPTPSGTLQIYW